MTARTISVLGAGSTSRRNVDALLADQHTANPITTIRVPGTAKHLSEGSACQFAADWALAHAVHLSIALDSGEEAKDLADLVAAGGAVGTVKDVVEALVTSPEVYLAVDWDDEDEVERIVLLTQAHGGKAFDLVDGLFPLQIEGAKTSEAQAEPTVPTGGPEMAADGTEVVPAPTTRKRAPKAPDEAQAVTFNLPAGMVAAADHTDAEIGAALRHLTGLLKSAGVL